MKLWKRSMAQAIVLMLTLGLIYTIAPARDREYRMIAEGLSARFQHTESEIVWQGLTDLVIGLARPAGLRRLKLTRFDQPANCGAWESVGDLVENALGPEWRPLLRQQSRRSGRETHIYVKSVGDSQRIIMVGVESGKATLMQATLDPTEFAAYLEHPVNLD